MFRSPPKFPEIAIPEDIFLRIAYAVRHEINEAFATFRYVASGKDLKNFLKVCDFFSQPEVTSFCWLQIFHNVFCR